MTISAPRAAHRPSRRQAVVDAAMELFAVQAPDMVTVADIAERAGMTSAAVYYHFASKDQILLEGVQSFGAALIAHAAQAADDLPRGGRLGEMMTGVVRWIDQHEAAGKTYFISSVGVNQDVEVVRRQQRTELLELLSRATRRARGRLAAGEAEVIGVGLLSLLETTVSSWLAKDVTYQKLGHRAFLAEVVALVDKVTGTAQR
ncbi:TetR/AcrR family transcriptional regulator [Actinomadura rudentiformis]|uniref:TetR/AcrR family transcriptional regulator n=1 Tax=Actinomadura rudentiformis TaxID=359158 RepID=A0A6H9YB91_9ACTN|nr:TetR/AcrR family transcriptional regulator [Actinomadura rudentiformis]KAB2340387.1 TetR/AcrR family transcriptional regulator [Actinomadura rudentiformis]